MVPWVHVLMFRREADPRLADIFVKKGPFLKMYTSYIKDYESMVSLLDETRHKNPDFDKIATDFEVDTNHYLLPLVFCWFQNIIDLFLKNSNWQI